MSHYLDQLLDPWRRAECARHDNIGDAEHMAGSVLDETSHRTSYSMHSATVKREGSLRGVTDVVTTETQRMEPIPGTALHWVRFTGIPWRTDGAQRRRTDPQHSRFGEFMG